MMAENLTQALLTKGLEIPIILERESFQLLAVSEVIIFIIGLNGQLKLDQS